MAGFSLDFNNVIEGGIKDGIYEVVIDYATEDATPGGAEFTNFQMTIRNDLDQPHKNQKIWHRVWKKKDTGQYSMVMFNTIGKAAGLQAGKVYNSFQELLDDFRGRPVQVYVKNETSEYNGKTYENLNVKQWKPTKFPDVQHQYKQSDNQTQSNNNLFDTNVQDSDLPF